MLLETPKTEGRSPTTIEIDPLDQRNLNTLRRLISEPHRRDPTDPQRAQRTHRRTT
jgi:hypothetical protein